MYAIELASGDVIYEYIPRFMTMGPGTQILLRLLPQQFEKPQCCY
jgi:hypothetical protein